MKKQTYFQTFYARRNMIQELFLAFFTSIASYPKLLLEVFIRKNFGTRYINMASIITVLIIFAWSPAITYQVGQFTGHARSFWGAYATWYVFLAAFLVMAVIRWRETHLAPAAERWERFSLSNGDIASFFYKLPFLKGAPSTRAVQTFYEPALFFLIGLLFRFCGQPVGTLLMVCSIIYALAYVSAYQKGDDFLRNHLDDMRCNQDVHDFLTKRPRPNQSGNVPIFFETPDDPNMCQKVADRIELNDDDDPNTVAL